MDPIEVMKQYTFQREISRETAMCVPRDRQVDNSKGMQVET